MRQQACQVASATSEQALLRRLRQDDESALDLVLQQYWDELVAYLSRWLGSTDDAEDVAQQTFLRLWDRREQWNPGGGSLRALLFRIARNLAISEQRSRNARTRAIVRATRDRAAGWVPTPLESLENQRLGRRLEQAIAALPDRRREVFVLRCVHDLSYREIAEVMGIAQQTVANQLSRALATLRQSLGHLLSD